MTHNPSRYETSSHPRIGLICALLLGPILVATIPLHAESPVPPLADFDGPPPGGVYPVEVPATFEGRFRAEWHAEGQ